MWCLLVCLCVCNIVKLLVFLVCCLQCNQLNRFIESYSYSFDVFSPHFILIICLFSPITMIPSRTLSMQREKPPLPYTLSTSGILSRYHFGRISTFNVQCLFSYMCQMCVCVCVARDISNASGSIQCSCSNENRLIEKHCLEELLLT